MGVPVLMGLPEGEATTIVRECGAGVCVPPEDGKAMARSLAQLADDPDLVRKLGQQARASAQRFSRDALAERVLRVLAKVGRVS